VGSVQRFEVSAEVFNGVRLVSVCGELDLATSPQVRELLTDVAKDDAQPLVIDLARCDFVDSTGLAALLHGAKPAQNGESRVAIISQAGDVRRMLELSAIDQSIPVFGDREQAVAAVLAMGP
jgi:anti-sigma B factor antagonist